MSLNEDALIAGFLSGMEKVAGANRKLRKAWKKANKASARGLEEITPKPETPAATTTTSAGDAGTQEAPPYTKKSWRKAYKDLQKQEPGRKKKDKSWLSGTWEEGKKLFTGEGVGKKEGSRRRAAAIGLGGTALAAGALGGAALSSRDRD